MRLVIVFVLLGAAVAQAPPQPAPGQMLPSLEDCRAARAFLLKDNPLFLALSASEMQDYEQSIGLCVMVDLKHDDYRALRRLLSDQRSRRMVQFAGSPGVWEQFLSWDADPANRQ